jgi:hypothetical protein
MRVTHDAIYAFSFEIRLTVVDPRLPHHDDIAGPAAGE